MSFLDDSNFKYGLYGLFGVFLCFLFVTPLVFAQSNISLFTYVSNNSVVAEISGFLNSSSDVSLVMRDESNKTYIGNVQPRGSNGFFVTFPIKPFQASFFAYLNDVLVSNVSESFFWENASEEDEAKVFSFSGEVNDMRGNVDDVAAFVNGKDVSENLSISGTRFVKFYEDDVVVLSLEHDFSSPLDFSDLSLYTYADGGVGAISHYHDSLTLYVPVNGEACNVRVCPDALSIVDCNPESMYYVFSDPLDGFCIVNVSGTYAKDDPEHTDFVVFTSNITFSPEPLVENSNVTINVTVTNIGLTWADNVTVLIINNATGDVLENHTIANFSSGETEYIFTSLTPGVGFRRIDVRIDPGNLFNESNESNNNASRWLNVSSWHTLYGFASRSIVLGGGNLMAFVWETNISSGNIYAADSDASINWGALYAIGINTSGNVATEDFVDVDVLLNLSEAFDNVSTLYSSDGTLALQTRDFFVYNDVVVNVPVAFSTNLSSFVTGLLWDSSDSFNGEFDTVDAEDVVVVTSINTSEVGSYGVYDYEMRIPSGLGRLKGTNDYVYLYMEFE